MPFRYMDVVFPIIFPALSDKAAFNISHTTWLLYYYYYFLVMDFRIQKVTEFIF